MQILDGSALSKKITDKIKSEIADLPSAVRRPRIDMILVGDSFASLKYVEMKEKKAHEVGFDGVIHRLPQNSSTADVVAKVDELNMYNDVDGFMVQLPMPEQIDQQVVLERISPLKDVDGLTSTNLGLLMQNRPNAIISATPLGVRLLIEEYGIEVEGKNAVVIGRGLVVGLPIFAVLNQMNATVTLAHSMTKDLARLCKSADIIVSAVGKPDLVTSEFVKEGAVVIDVGISKKEGSKKLAGDIAFEEVKDICSYISPVPGGVGPMTIAALMLNTYNIWKATK